MVAFQLATMGSAVSGATAELFAANAYREYLELHGLSVQLTEALAEYWHARVRKELGIASEDPADLDGFFSVKYQGARYSIGYPACPDLADRAKIARLLSRSGSASNSRRRCSCTPSSPPTRSSSTTRRRGTSPSSGPDRPTARCRIMRG